MLLITLLCGAIGAGQGQCGSTAEVTIVDCDDLTAHFHRTTVHVVLLII